MKSNPMAHATRGISSDATEHELDAGFRRRIPGVYGYLAAGLALSGVVGDAAVALRLPDFLLQFPVLFAGAVASPFIVALLVGFQGDKLKSGSAHLVFWGYSLLVGLSFSVLFTAYVGETIAPVLFLSAATFLAMFVYGDATRCDLASLDASLGMVTLGIVIVSVSGIVLSFSPLQFGISLAGVVASVGLTARDASRMRHAHSTGPARLKPIQGALALYTGLIDLPRILRWRS